MTYTQEVTTEWSASPGIWRKDTNAHSIWRGQECVNERQRMREHEYSSRLRTGDFLTSLLIAQNEFALKPDVDHPDSRNGQRHEQSGCGIASHQFGRRGERIVGIDWLDEANTLAEEAHRAGSQSYAARQLRRASQRSSPSARSVANSARVSVSAPVSLLSGPSPARKAPHRHRRFAS